jgi:5-methyltetrahydropteroyltriglutamate--homocysteine methyltransferase
MARLRREDVAQRAASVKDEMVQRHSRFVERRQKQGERLKLPLLPTTLIGSLPQTSEVRTARAAYKSGKMERASYEAFLRKEIEQAIRFQEEVGLDVLVHGEFERNDMVEYFGEQLEGMAVTQNGWVQSSGSLCVRPPILYGDIARERPMTVGWSHYAQSLTTRPVKGMLTGPVTIQQWSFVRDDQPRSETYYQLALALRDEVLDLELPDYALFRLMSRHCARACPCGTPTGAAIFPGQLPASTLHLQGYATTRRSTHICAMGSLTISSKR